MTWAHLASVFRLCDRAHRSHCSVSDCQTELRELNGWVFTVGCRNGWSQRYLWGGL